ncbi:HigA family addiction module antitoxin [Syntrophomonas wolfei]|uniref:Putative plasmid maintenance system antidote protein, XRE family n=1 Tax=Syntrophomonas wolfei subsp. wolfei (strain DSM 2245B / Goettingen) TaxID=335541 RepID=Q0AZN6_SYNWW|nr:HigA family addiction module antitoxin [Syntrophomonas wolfei]ABI67818.1 putative plasmid maintenance system antidote protein, XRE family [Syntrophomonas wolfei subsp. wolfei str. Goettingen G311]
MVRSRTIIASPPGATIKEQLVDRGMSQKEFARRMDMSEKHISRLINGEVQLTPDMAMRLEMVLGAPAQFWSRLESVYREKLAKANAENEMDADIEIAKKFPYKEMSKNGWVPETSKAKEKVVHLRKHFEVVQLGLLQGTLIPGIACRRLADHKKADYALYAWAQKAKLEARHIDTKPININKLSNIIPHIRKMTRENPGIFCGELVSMLADCGIAIVFLPHIGGSFLHGATFYDGGKIVMGLTVRGKDADRFWFSLFHEFAHIIYGHIGQPNGTSDADESAADEFAKETLIPSKEFNSFIAKKDFSKSSLVQFANVVGIDAGIVVGRLQKEGYIEYSWYNDLKTKYKITA